MADITNGGVKRTDEGIVYVFGQAAATTALPSGAVTFKGPLPRTKTLAVTKDAQMVVFFV